MRAEGGVKQKSTGGVGELTPEQKEFAEWDTHKVLEKYAIRLHSLID